MNPFEFLSHLFLSIHESILPHSDSRSHIELEMDEIPVDQMGRPDLRYFTKPLEHYIRVYEEGWSDPKSAPKWSGQPDDPNLTIINKLCDLGYRKRVHATWGLIAKGAEAIPYACQMLKSPIPDVREDGAGILGALGKEEGIVEALSKALDTETDEQTRGSMIGALGELKNRKAIPRLAELIRNPNGDGDNRWAAMQSLGRIVRKRFDKKTDPMAAAQEWLNTHHY